MPKAAHQNITSRRALLAGAALVAPASLLPTLAVVAAGEDPALPGACPAVIRGGVDTLIPPRGGLFLA